ncbi:MAG: hypothetical protein QOE06_286 [Thermoleophilaceae bacterium]|jgi:hypothetical protein|nr:hypothetical protein [Thermoleophilaceae bacterium]
MSAEDQRYEPPEIEEMPAADGPAITAAGDSPPPDGQGAVEWRPEERSDER